MGRTPVDERRVHRILVTLYVIGALVFAWAGITRMPFLAGSAVLLIASAIEWRTRMLYPPHNRTAHVAPLSWRTRRIAAFALMPAVLLAYVAEDVIRSGLSVADLPVLVFAAAFVAMQLWLSYGVVESVEVRDAGIALGIRTHIVEIAWEDVVAVGSFDWDGLLSVRTRGGHTYRLSAELSDFTQLRAELARSAGRSRT